MEESWYSLDPKLYQQHDDGAFVVQTPGIACRCTLINVHFTQQLTQHEQNAQILQSQAVTSRFNGAAQILTPFPSRISQTSIFPHQHLHGWSGISPDVQTLVKICSHEYVKYNTCDFLLLPNTSFLNLDKSWNFLIVIFAVFYLQPQCHPHTIYKMNSFFYIIGIKMGCCSLPEGGGFTTGLHYMADPLIKSENGNKVHPNSNLINGYDTCALLKDISIILQKFTNETLLQN